MNTSEYHHYGSWQWQYMLSVGMGGAATAASLYDPYGVALDGLGNLYIADSGNSRIRKVNTSGIISTVAGNGSQGFSGDGGGRPPQPVCIIPMA